MDIFPAVLLNKNILMKKLKLVLHLYYNHDYQNGGC